MGLNDEKKRRLIEQITKNPPGSPENSYASAELWNLLADEATTELAETAVALSSVRQELRLATEEGVRSVHELVVELQRAQLSAAEGTVLLARWTKWQAFASIVLAILTAALVVVTVIGVLKVAPPN